MRRAWLGEPLRLTRALALALAVTFAAPSVVPAVAASDPDDRKASVDRQLAKARENLDDLSEDAKTAFLALRATQLAVPGAQKAVADAQARLVAADARKRDLDAQLVVAKQQQAANEAALAANAVQIDTAENRRDQMARKAYEDGGLESFGELVMLMSPGDAHDLTDLMYLVEKASTRQRAVLGDLREAREAALLEQQRLEAARRRVAQLSLQAKAALLDAEDARTSAQAAQSRLHHLATLQKRQAAALDRRVNAEKRRVDELQAASDKLAALLAARAKARREAAARRAQSNGRVDRAPAATNGPLAYPVNAPITSEFGMRYHPILRYSRLHAGVDFGAACGTPVYASAAGDVVQAGWSGGYGNSVVIAHGDSLATTYNHLQSIEARGGSVSRGQLIGYVGTTGLSTGCHLHFEVRVNGTPVNPRGYL